MPFDILSLPIGRKSIEVERELHKSALGEIGSRVKSSLTFVIQNSLTRDNRGNTIPRFLPKSHVAQANNAGSILARIFYDCKTCQLPSRYQLLVIGEDTVFLGSKPLPLVVAWSSNDR